MTQTGKDLLLKDLCARLPYGVKVLYENEIFDVEYVCPMYEEVKLDNHETWTLNIEEVKPYLFPLSSMTDEQKEFVKNKFCYDWDIDDHPYSLWAYCIGIGDMDELIDWFHTNQFDYRGLIPMGLAIDATGLDIY